jgi:hypothetical protein
MIAKPNNKKSNIGKISGAIGGLVGILTICVVIIAIIQLWSGLNDSRKQENSQATLLALSGKQLEAQQTLVALQQNPGSQNQIQAVQTTISKLEFERHAIEASLTPNSFIQQPSIVVSTPTIEPFISLPFEDNFNNGLSSAWNILSGEPVISNGKLKTTEGGLVIGLCQKLPPNFSIQIDFDLNYGHAPGNVLKIVMDDIRVDFNNTNVQWDEFRDNSWNQIEYVNGWGDSGNLRLVVNGNKYIVYLNGNKHSEVIFGLIMNNHQISIDMNTDEISIDNLMITNP